MTYQANKPPAQPIPRSQPTLKEQLLRYEQHLITQALENNRFNRKKTARELGIDRVWLYTKMKRYGMIADTKHRGRAHKKKEPTND